VEVLESKAVLLFHIGAKRSKCETM